MVSPTMSAAGKGDYDSGQYVRLIGQDPSISNPNKPFGTDPNRKHECTLLECCCCPCICAFGCLGCLVGTVVICMGSCVYSLMQCCGCAPEVRLEHIERFVYGKELWQAFLDGEGCGPDDPARAYCEGFFASTRFQEKIDHLFDQYDVDQSGKLDRDEVVELLSGLSTALVATMSGMGPDIVENSEDKEKIKQAYVQMFEDKSLELDRGTFYALAKLITAQLILSASVNMPKDFIERANEQAMPVVSSVKIEELSSDDEEQPNTKG